MNKEEINTVTIPLETYMDLIQRATFNDMLMNEIRNVDRKVFELETRLYELEREGTRR